MNQRDPLDSFEDALFRAARRERPQSAARERTESAVVTSYRKRRSRRSVFVVAAALALAAGAAFVLRGARGAEPIEAEHIVPKHSSNAAREPLTLPHEPSLALSAAASASAADAQRVGLAPSVASTTIEEERAMLDRARGALDAGDAASALSQLDRYDRVSGGHLTAEATLLRIQALSKSGRASLAAKLARRFVDSDPRGPLAERARDYLPKPGAEQKP